MFIVSASFLNLYLKWKLCTAFLSFFWAADNIDIITDRSIEAIVWPRFLILLHFAYMHLTCNAGMGWKINQQMKTQSILCSKKCTNRFTLVIKEKRKWFFLIISVMFAFKCPLLFRCYCVYIGAVIVVLWLTMLMPADSFAENVSFYCCYCCVCVVE